MSKCREAFIAYQGFTPERLPNEWIDWICAWNAATENAAKVCDFKETEWDNEDRAQSAAAFHLAEAIRKEKTE